MSARTFSHTVLTVAAILASTGACAGALRASDGAQASEPAADSRPVIAEDLAAKLTGLAPQAPVRVVIRLKNSPWIPLMRAEREKLRPSLEVLAQQIQDIHRASRPAESLSPAQELQWLRELGEGRHAVPPMQAALREQLAEQIESLTAEARRRVREQVLPIIDPEHEHIGNSIIAAGGTVISRSIGLSALTADLPAGALAAIAADPLIDRIFEIPAGKPAMDVSIPSLGVPSSFWANNVFGQSWDVGVMDSGIQQNHPAFAGVNFLNAPGVGTTDLAVGHGTGVAGIITSRDALYRGVAPAIDRVLVGLAQTDLAGDPDWMLTTAPDDPEAINLSWEFGIAVADDGDIEQFFDAIVDDFDCSVIIAAGNEGGTTSTLTRPSTARNAICVGDLDIRGTVNRDDDRLRGTSGHGPVPGSLRKKPDLAAPGDMTWTANAQWQSASDWVQFGGTSSAAPHVSGGYLLVLQTRGDQTPEAIKSVLINTADAWSDQGTDTDYSDDGPYSGSLWNKAYGWGSANLGAAYFNSADVFKRTASTMPGGTSEFYFAGTLFNGEKSTLVWNRPLVYNGAAMPPGVGTTANLNLRLYRQSDGALIDSSLSLVDNVEQVGINAVALAGDEGTPVVARVSLVSPNSVVPFALATEENFAQVTGPALTSNLLTTQAGPGQSFNLQIAVTNPGDVTAQNVIVTLDAPPAGWTFGSIAANVGAIPAGQTRYASFTVNPPCPAAGTVQISWAASSSSYGQQVSIVGAGDITLTAPSTLINNTPETIGFSAGSAIRSIPIVADDFHVVATRHIQSNWDLRLDSTGCMVLPSIAASTLPFPEVDLVVINTNNPLVPNVDTRHVSVALDSLSLAFYNTRLEFQRGNDIPGSTAGVTLAADQVIEVFEKSLAAGARYSAVAAVLSGTPDLELRIYSPSTTHAGPVASHFANAAGPGADESISFTASESGVYGFVITKRNSSAGDIEFRIACAADFNFSGSVAVDDIFAFLAAWFANEPRSDFDENGAIAVQDIFAFLAAWFAGC